MPSERELSAFQVERNLYQAERLGLETSGYSVKKSASSWSGVGRFLKRNFWLLTLPALTFGGAALYLILKTPDMFLGEFQLLVEPITSPETVANKQSGGQVKQQPFDYETLIRLLVSSDVLNPALLNIESQGVDIDVDALQRKLRVQRIGQNRSNSKAQKQTKLVSVQFEDPQPERIEVILKELAKRYLQYGENERRKSLGGGVEFIEKQLPEVRQRVTSIESQIQKLEQKYRIGDLDSEGAALATRSRELEAQRQQIQPALKAQQQLKVNLEQQLKLTPSQVVAASQVSENPNIQAFSQQLQGFQAELNVKSSIFSASHPEVVALQEQIRTVEASLRKETQKVIGASLPGANLQAGAIPQSQSELQKALGKQLIATINEIQVLQIQNQAIIQASASIDEDLRQFPSVKRQYTELQSKLAIDRQLLNKLLLDREEFRVQTAQNEIPWQVVKQPTLLKDSNGRLISTANKDWNKIGFATLGGLLLGIGAAMLKEKRQNIFYSLDDLKESVPLNLMGMVPYDSELKSVSRAKASMPSESDEETDYQFGYPMRLLKVSENIYANLRYLLSEQSPHSLVLGSVMAGDGKTTLAINLSKAVAGMGQRVLLVDANLSVPQLHSRFGLPNFQGLSDILAQEIDPNELIQRSPLHSNLFLLTAGQMSRKASKLLASNQMTYLMEQLHNMFDLVIYDTHHLQGSSGANFLALNAQGLILVVGIQKTRRSAVLKTLERLENSRIPLNGMVANFVREPIARLDESDVEEGMPNSIDVDVEDDEFEIFRVE